MLQILFARSHTSYTWFGVTSSQCGNQRRTLPVPFTATVARNKNAAPAGSLMEVECSKTRVYHSPESCRSRTVSPLFSPLIWPYCVFGQCHRESLLVPGHGRAQDGGGWRGVEGWGATPGHFSLPVTGCGISHYRRLLHSRDVMTSSARSQCAPTLCPQKTSSPFIGFGTPPCSSPPPLEEMAGLPICVCSGSIFFWKMHQCFPNGKSNHFQKEGSCGS